MICDEAQEMLERYLDSELPVGEAAEFEQHLRACGACSAQALGGMKLKQSIRRAGIRYVPAPEFRSKMQTLVRAQPQRRAGWGLAMSAAAVVLLAVCFGFLWQRSARERTFSELADLHVSALASANPVDVVSSDRHTVKPWFAGRIPFSFNLPELQGSAFSLDGGRVTYLHHAPAAQLLYHLRQHRISVFIVQEQAAGMPFSLGDAAASRMAMQTTTWSHDGLRYFFIGDATTSDLNALSDLFHAAARH